MTLLPIPISVAVPKLSVFTKLRRSRQDSHLVFPRRFPYSLGSQSGSVVVVAAADSAAQVLVAGVAAVVAAVARVPSRLYVI